MVVVVLPHFIFLHIIKAEREVKYMESTIFKKENIAMDYPGYALYAFGGLGIEILLMTLETNLWGISNNQWF